LIWQFDPTFSPSIFLDGGRKNEMRLKCEMTEGPDFPSWISLSLTVREDLELFY